MQALMNANANKARRIVRDRVPASVVTEMVRNGLAVTRARKRKMAAQLGMIALHTMNQTNPAQFRKMRANGTAEEVIRGIVTQAERDHQIDGPMAEMTPDWKMREEFAIQQVIEAAKAAVTPPEEEGDLGTLGLPLGI